MAMTDTASGVSVRGFSLARKLVKALAGGRSAYVLSGLTLLSTISLAFLEQSLVLNVYMAGVALVILCSIIALSLQDQDKANCSGQKSLPKLDKASLKARPSAAGLAKLQLVDTEDEKVSPLQFADDCKSTKKSIQVCTLPTNDSIQTEFNAAPAIGATKVKSLGDSAQETTFAPKPNTLNVTPISSIDKEISLGTKPDAQAKNRKTFFAKGPPLLPEIVLKTTAAKAFVRTSDPVVKSTIVKSLSKECISKMPTIVSVTKESSLDSQPDAQVKHTKTVFTKAPPLLPENVLKDPAPEALAATNNAIAKDTTCENERVPKKKREIFKGQGQIFFLHSTKVWGRIRLSKPTKWGENLVFFHRDYLVGNKDVLLFHGQSVKVDYRFRRKHNSLAATRVEVVTSSPPFTRQPKRSPNKPRELKSWRSRSMRRRPLLPPSRASAPRPMRVAKGPSPDGSRGFRFRRTVVM